LIYKDQLLMNDRRYSHRYTHLQWISMERAQKSGPDEEKARWWALRRTAATRADYGASKDAGAPACAEDAQAHLAPLERAVFVI
jgi:hypothetical protein